MKGRLLINNIGELATPVDKKGPLRGKEQGKITEIKNAALYIENGKFRFVGKREEVLKKIKGEDFEYIDAEGRAVVPGFVDPHTHLIYMGDRHEEFYMRLAGASYIEILEKGYGILETMRKTREATFEELVEAGYKRLRVFVENGTTSIEVKSGYALEPDGEVRMLKAALEVGKRAGIKIVTTFLGAHAIPPEWKNDREGYINLLLNDMLEKAKPYAEFCDVFQDKGAFTYEESERILRKAKELGYKLKLHADEIENTRASFLAAELGAISADHLTKVDEISIERMKKSNTIAVLLPGTSFILRHSYAPARKLIDEGIPVALATDHNPGTSPIYSQQITMSLGVIEMEMKPEEALTAVTLNAAYAMDIADITGSIEPGKNADLVILDAHSYKHIPYEFGRNLAYRVLAEGEVKK